MQTKNLIKLFILIAIISLQVQIWHNPDGLTSLVRLKQDEQNTMRNITRMEQLNQHLIQEITSLKQNRHAIEAHIRYKLGAIKADEIFIMLVDPEPSAKK